MGYVEFAIILAAVVSAAAAGTSAYAQKQEADYQGDLAKYNAKVSEQQARDAAEAKNQEITRIRDATEAMKSSQRAALAANGIDLSSESPLAIMADTAYYGELDASNASGSGEREQLAYQRQKTNLLLDAKMAGNRGRYAVVGGALSATGSLAGGYGAVKGRQQLSSNMNSSDLRSNGGQGQYTVKI